MSRNKKGAQCDLQIQTILQKASFTTVSGHCVKHKKIVTGPQSPVTNFVQCSVSEHMQGHSIAYLYDIEQGGLKEKVSVI